MKYQRHSATSKAAAVAIAAQAPNIRHRVYVFICATKQYGATDEEIINSLGLSANTGRARRVELWDASKIYESGRTRSTVAGRQAVIWVDKKYRQKGTIPLRKSTRGVQALKRKIAQLQLENDAYRIRTKRYRAQAKKHGIILK